MCLVKANSVNMHMDHTVFGSATFNASLNRLVNRNNLNSDVVNVALALTTIFCAEEEDKEASSVGSRDNIEPRITPKNAGAACVSFARNNTPAYYVCKITH